MNPFNNLRPMPPSPCGCAPRPWPRPVVPVPVTPQMQPHWAEELRRILDGKQDVIADLDEIRAATVGAYKKPEDGIPKTDLAAGVQASLDNADTAVQPAAITGFVDGAEYDADYGSPPKPMILLKHGSEVVATVDATDFVIDGMVSNVEVKNGNLVITFNTDSGKQPISIPLTDIFNPDNYYTKTDVNGLLAGKLDKSGDTMTGPLTIVRSGDNIKIDGSTIRFNDVYGNPTGGTISGTDGGGNVYLPTSGGTIALVTDIPAVVAPSTSASASGKAADAKATGDALAGKLSTSGGTVVGTLGVTDPEDPELAVFEVIPGADGSAPTMRFSHAPGVVGLRWKIAQTIDGHENVVMEASNELGETRQINLPFTAGTLALAASPATAGNLATLDSQGNPMDSGKKPSDFLDSTSAAPAFTAKIYAVNNLCTYNGVIYRCKVGYTATASSTKPDADTTHWEVKPASDLFLPLTGGTVRGKIWVQGDLSWGGSAASISTISNSGISLRDGTQVLSYPSASGTLALAAPTVATAGNLAALDAQGNPTDSGKKAGDFATAAQGTKADTAIQGVKVNGTALAPDANKAVNVQVPSAGSALPLIAGVSDAGSSANFSREDHVHPAETEVLPPGYALPASAFPVSAYGRSTSDPADIELFDATAGSGYVSQFAPSYGEVVAMKMSWQDEAGSALAMFDKSSGAFITGDGTLSFNGNSGVEGVSPVLTARDSTVIVRGVEVASSAALALKQSKITASGILKGDGAGGVSTATAGTDYQAPLGFTPENASNKVTSLTAQSTDAQYPSAKCVYDAIQGVDVKPTRIYDSSTTPTTALDNKGQMYKQVSSGNFWMSNLTNPKLSYTGYSDGKYRWSSGTGYAGKELAYDPENGHMYFAYYASGWRTDDLGEVQPRHVNPTTGGVLNDMPTVALENTTGAWFTASGSIDTTPYAYLALESLPDRTWAAGTWVVGDLVKYDGKAYRCKADATSSSTTAPSSDTTHWTEIPVLAQKQDALSQTQLDNIAAVPNKANDNAVIHKTGNETIYGTKLFSGWRAYTEVATQQHFIEFSTSGESSPPFAILFQNGDANSQYRYALPLKSGVMALLSDLADYAPLNSPAFTGTPTAPTPSSGDDSTKVANTAFVQGAIPYSLVTKTISNDAVTLDDRADNYVDARALGSSDSLDVDFPALVEGKSRDFVLAVECGANPPTISYAAFVTIMAEDASTLVPEEGMNIYAFTEFKPNMFLASRKTVDTVVVNTPENSEQLLLAMQKQGISTTGVTNFGGVETALGLSDTDTPQDAVDAVMN